MKLNVLKLSLLARPRTYEGAPAIAIPPEAALRRSVLACMLWEDEFYESGQTIAARIHELVPRVAPEAVAALAVEARTAMKLRHAPLLLVREMARYATHRALVAETLVRVIQRADELAEFVAIYWAEGRVPLSAQVKQGLAAAFTNFDEYALAKYDRIVIITDEQSHDRVPAPRGRGYVINVASARNGVGYGPWLHIDGFSEAVLDYIRESERTNINKSH